MTTHLVGIGSPAEALSWIEGTRISLDSLASLVCLSNSTELLAMILALFLVGGCNLRSSGAHFAADRSLATEPALILATISGGRT
jgi:hypothetical protein